MIIKRSPIFLRKKATTTPNKNQHHKQNPNSLASGTYDSDMQLILRVSILGSLELLEDWRQVGAQSLPARNQPSHIAPAPGDIADLHDRCGGAAALSDNAMINAA
jgi:hypothetical protein